MKWFIVLVLLCPCAAFAQQDIESSILVNNIKRDYLVHLPAKNPQRLFPVVLAFHGGGSSALQMKRYLDMDRIADTAGCIIVYPSGLNQQWNDGRDFNATVSANDDVQFISQLIDTLVSKYSVDPKRIFATGISNGGFFSIYLSWKLNNRISGIAPVCASIPEKIVKQFTLDRPVPILLINGTADPIVPYNGGMVGGRLLGDRGRCLSTEQTIESYLKLNNIQAQPQVKGMRNNNLHDRCTAVEYIYSDTNPRSLVILIKVQNGGHTLPGGNYLLPKRAVGNTCKDFSASQRIWEFFSVL